ncbi:hypothetical protein BDV41DRAFT_518935 [Aspergillus transmontanensis]|uniref:Uncharacterized protein n=1 Tax=Aspergillus transmontanensis TaxID=1034304 RepID=A0A5N6WG98_9EURO|nr:hypothetical protein BDV41DRAFT_518935 [Aspergillus transmontanensis]
MPQLRNHHTKRSRPKADYGRWGFLCMCMSSIIELIPVRASLSRERQRTRRRTSRQ